MRPTPILSNVCRHLSPQNSPPELRTYQTQIALLQALYSVPSLMLEVSKSYARRSSYAFPGPGARDDLSSKSHKAKPSGVPQARNTTKMSDNEEMPTHLLLRIPGRPPKRYE